MTTALEDINCTEPEVNQHLRCIHCASALRVGGYSRLWDGRTYCHQCIESASPKLLAWSIANPASIHETMPHSSRSIGWLNGRFSAATCLGFAFVMSLGALWGGSFGLAIGIFLFFCALSFPLVPLFAYAARVNIERNRPTASVAEGRLLVQAADKTYDTSLCDVTWSDGKVWDMVVLIPNIILPGDPTITLRWKHERWFPKNRVCVGYTEDMREIWRAFLTLAAVARRDDKLTKKPYVPNTKPLP